MPKIAAVPLALSAIFVQLAGCSQGETPRPTPPSVAAIDGEPVTLAELELYLDAHLLTEGELQPTSAAQADQIKSRLFDALIEERLLLAEAEREEVPVTDLEIEASLDLQESEDAAVPDALWKEARRRLMIQKLQEQTTLGQPPISDEDVTAYLEQNRERWTPARRVRMRSLRSSTAEDAERIYQNIRRRRTTFDEAVVAQGNPDLAVPVELNWESLSEEIRTALDGLKPGQVSRPVAHSGAHFLFQLEAWLNEPHAIEVELLAQARQALEDRRRQRIYEGLIEQLRETADIELKLRDLPFDYVPREPE